MWSRSSGRRPARRAPRPAARPVRARDARNGARRGRTRQGRRGAPRSAPRRNRRLPLRAARAGSRGRPRSRAGRARSRHGGGRTGRASPSADVPARRKGERVDLVRRREHAPALGRGQRPAGGIGQVLLLDRSAHRLGVAGQARVLGADPALELRELAYELGGLVGLRQPGRLERRVSPTEPLDQLLQPLGLVGERASAFEERDARQARRQAVDPGLDVALEAEGGIVEAVLQDLRVAGADDVGSPPFATNAKRLPSSGK